MRSRAFILEPCSHDVRKASKYGDITYLFKHKKTHTPPIHEAFAEEVVGRLHDLEFWPGIDYLVITGQLHSMVAMTAAVVAEYGPVKTLMFDGAEGVEDYVVVIMGECHAVTKPSRVP